MAVLAVGVGASSLAAASARRAERQNLSVAMDRRADAVRLAVGAEVRRYADAVSNVAAAVGASRDLTAAEFAATTAQLPRQRLVGAGGIALVVPADDDQLAATARRWSGPGTGRLTLHPDRPGAEHRFTVLSRPLNGRTMRLGSDVGTQPGIAEALDQARRTDRVAASSAYGPRTGRGQESPTGGWFALAAPVASGPSTPARLRGWVVAEVRGQDVLDGLPRRIAHGTVALAVTDLGGDTLQAPVARLGAETPAADPTTLRRATMRLAGRTWTLDTGPTRALASTTLTHRPALTFGGGALVTLLLATLVLSLAGARDRAMARVRAATRAMQADIARRDEAEAELAAFAGVVAHDLRNPLTSVAGYAGLLADHHGEQLDEVGRGYLTQIEAASARMSRLIDSLLAHATAEDLVLAVEPTNLNAVVEDVVREYVGHRGGDRPSVETCGDLPTVAADPALLRQLLDNLVGNALKYVPHGHTPQVEISARPVPGAWQVEVTDRGIGVPEEDTGRIFQAFRRARGSEGYPGSGLGLAICARIVERHGGEIGAEPRARGGSRFWFTLPRVEATRPARSLRTGLVAPIER